jgi:diaminopimelate decarboxylase
MKKLGVGLDIASGGELEAALRAGFRAERMSFVGPGKTLEELQAALKAGVGIIQIESFGELDLIDSIGRAQKKRPRVGVRVNPISVRGRVGMMMGSGPKPFGIDEELLPEFLGELQKKKNLEFRGIHFFPSSQILDDEVVLGNFENAIRIAGEVERMYGKPLSTVNVGGGFGIPYYKNEKLFEIRRLGAGLTKLMSGTKDQLKEARFFVESGRYLIGESGVYLTRVLYRKVSRGVTFLITDGGINHHLAASGKFGAVIRRNFDIRNVTRLNEPLAEKVHVAGPLCTPLDILAEDLFVPKTQPGDVLGIFNSGAYGLSASPVGFLSHPLPKEYFI